VSALAPSEKTAVAVARALRRDDEYPAKLLVLDEPTATLPYNDVNTLLDTVRAVADRGVAVMFVTHHLDEVFRLGDATTILRDGEVVGTYQLSEIDRSVLVEKLTGSAHELATPAVALSAGPSDGARHLAVRGLTAASLADIDISADAGEVIGIAGITGSGRESILGAIFGALPRDGGTVELDGTTIPRGRPDRAIAAGMAFLPADRANDSGILSLSATDNLTLSDLRPAWAGGRLIRRRQWTEATKWFTDLDVRPRDGIRQLLSSFSGGNQQKILLGKWLRLTPKVLLLDEPTQGVDIAAKAEIHRLIAAAAREGAAVLVASTDIEELGTLCSRVLILRQGRIAEELTGSSVGVPNITHAFMSDVASTTHEGGEIRGE
jgi:ribose transport system ATP-binding protein